MQHQEIHDLTNGVGLRFVLEDERVTNLRSTNRLNFRSRGLGHDLPVKGLFEGPKNGAGSG